MTEEFKLETTRVSLCICDKEFCIELCSETADLCGEILKEAKKRLKLLKSGSNDVLVSENGICEFLKESVDRFLGEGATTEILGEKISDICLVANLMCYVVSQIRDGFKATKLKP